MNAEILATGDEIRSGALVDSNSAFIAEALENIGVSVSRHNAAGDDFDVLVTIFKEIGGRADICIVTGGLGPTTDDLTAEAAASAAGVKLLLDEKALSDIKAFFQKRQRTMTESNKKQAFMPVGSDPMYNLTGYGTGFLYENRTMSFFLPGVPPEMRRMLQHDVLPSIQKLTGMSRNHCLIRTISTFGLTESATGEKVAGLVQEFPEIKLGLRTKFPEIHVKLYLNGQDLDKLNHRLNAATEWVSGRIGRHILSTKGAPMPEVVGHMLRERAATVAVAESCTGGRIADWLTDVPGSSDYFVFSAVTYSNDSKLRILGVSSDILEKHGAVHEETCKAMADRARRVSGATYAISTSGIAGPSGGTKDKPVGTVCIGMATPEKVVGRRFFFPFGKRSMNKSIFGVAALDMLRKELLK